MWHDDWGERTPRWAGVRSATVTVGTEVAALAAGPASAPPGVRPQLLVHGLGGSATDWLEVLPTLGANGPVLAPDLPGFGRTAPAGPGASRIQANARFLDELLDELGWDRVVVHGNSMGGLLAVLLAGRVRKRVERLVLASPALPTTPLDLRHLHPVTALRFVPFVVPRLGRLVLGRMYASMTPEQQVADMARFVHADPERISPELRAVSVEQAIAARGLEWRLDGFVQAAESLVAGLLTGGALTRAVDAIEAPTLVVRGEHDRLVGRPVVEHLRRRRPDVEVVELPGVGHVPMVEDPDGYLDALAGWRPLMPPAGERPPPR